MKEITPEEIIEKIRDLIAGTIPSEDSYDDMAEDLKNRLSVDICLSDDDIPEGMEMADILSFWAMITWDGMKHSGVSVGIKGSEIIEKIRSETDPIYDGNSRAGQYREYALAFSQLGKRLNALARETKKEGNRMKQTP